MSVVDLYPNIDEILGEDSTKRCDICDKSLHRVKTHKIVVSIEDKRIFCKASDGLGRTFYYHCPVEGCMKRKVKFDGMRNLKQHYLRVHTEKTIACECGTRFALQKDFVYHKKSRCMSRDLHIRPVSSAELPISSNRKLSKSLQTRSTPDCRQRSNDVTSLITAPQPTIIIVPTDDVQATIERISSSLRTTCEVAVQAQTSTFLPQTSTVGVGNDLPQSFDFSGQYNSLPHTSFYCSESHTPDVRHISTGTDFSFGDSNFINYESQNSNEYSSFGYNTQNTDTIRQNIAMSYTPYNPAESVETRSFGTIIDQSLLNGEESNTIRHAGTSMDHALDFLRDTETQTLGLEDNAFYLDISNEND